ncbi:hypothetical protein HDV06_006146 [Boothiomyces sp. JEL0866]|nr:hypothetical protein HDV06_006146 [Boothiomyces sp. JEL0866]
MNFESLHKLQFRVMDYISQDAILKLSLTNKYYYQLLRPIRILKSWIHVGTFWPKLTLFAECLGIDLETVDESILDSVLNFSLTFRILQIDAAVFRKLGYRTPSAHKIHLRIKGDTTPDDINRLLDLSSLWSIEVSSTATPLTIDCFLASLSQLQITKLAIARARITQDQISAIAANIPKSLLFLSLHRCAIDDLGAEKISLVIPESNLISVDLSSNSITTVGLTALARILPISNLTTLTIDNNLFHPSDLHILNEKLANSKLEKLQVEITNERIADALSSTIAHSNLVELTIGIQEQYLNDLLRQISISKVKILTIVGVSVPFDDNSASILVQHLPQLELHTLKLYACSITGAAMIQILDAVNRMDLSFLSITRTDLNSISKELGDFIAKSKLSHLQLMSGDVNYNSLMDLVDGVKQSAVKEISFAFNKFSAQEILDFRAAIKGSRNLNNLFFQAKDPVIQE